MAKAVSGSGHGHPSRPAKMKAEARGGKVTKDARDQGEKVRLSKRDLGLR